MDIQIKYKEYRATEPNVLLSILDFSSCSMAMCNMNTNLKFIEVPLNIATTVERKYKDALEDTNPDDIETITTVRNILYQELAENGYNVDNTVEPIIHGE